MPRICQYAPFLFFLDILTCFSYSSKDAWFMLRVHPDNCIIMFLFVLYHNGCLLYLFQDNFYALACFPVWILFNFLCRPFPITFTWDTWLICFWVLYYMFLVFFCFRFVFVIHILSYVPEYFRKRIQLERQWKENQTLVCKSENTPTDIISVNWCPLKLEQFTYLGRVITWDGRSKTKITRRINQTCIISVCGGTFSHPITSVRKSLLELLVRSVALFGGKTS